MSRYRHFTPVWPVGSSIFHVSESCLQTFVWTPRPNVRPVSRRLSARKSKNPHGVQRHTHVPKGMWTQVWTFRAVPIVEHWKARLHLAVDREHVGEFVCLAAAALFIFCTIFSYLFVYFFSYFFMSGSFLSSFRPPEEEYQNSKKKQKLTNGGYKVEHLRNPYTSVLRRSAGLLSLPLEYYL